jgi:hypothetical protein
MEQENKKIKTIVIKGCTKNCPYYEKYKFDTGWYHSVSDTGGCLLDEEIDTKSTVPKTCPIKKESILLTVK